jgi:hypothetical protein
MSAMEQYYYAVLLHWYRYIPDRAPTCLQIAAVCNRDGGERTPIGQSRTQGWPSHTAVRSAFLSLESKGYLKRNNDGRFEVLP